MIPYFQGEVRVFCHLTPDSSVKIIRKLAELDGHYVSLDKSNEIFYRKNEQDPSGLSDVVNKQMSEFNTLIYNTTLAKILYGMGTTVLSNTEVKGMKKIFPCRYLITKEGYEIKSRNYADWWSQVDENDGILPMQDYNHPDGIPVVVANIIAEAIEIFPRLFIRTPEKRWERVYRRQDHVPVIQNKPKTDPVIQNKPKTDPVLLGVLDAGIILHDGSVLRPACIPLASWTRKGKSWNYSGRG